MPPIMAEAKPFPLNAFLTYEKTQSQICTFLSGHDCYKIFLYYLCNLVAFEILLHL